LYSREEYEEPNFFLQNKENKTEQKHKRWEGRTKRTDDPR
jgi:hypothetical protein